MNDRGFTYIEVMITVAVIALAVVGTMGTNIMIQQQIETTHERATAIQDANRVIEQMRNAANTAGTSFQTSVQTAATAAASSVGSFPTSYNETIAVNYVNASSDPMDATVTVTWQTRGLSDTDAQRTVAVRALFTRRIS